MDNKIWIFITSFFAVLFGLFKYEKHKNSKLKDDIKNITENSKKDTFETIQDVLVENTKEAIDEIKNSDNTLSSNTSYKL